MLDYEQQCSKQGSAQGLIWSWDDGIFAITANRLLPKTQHSQADS